MASMARILKDGTITKTTCCKAPVRLDTEKEVGVYFCKRCDEEVTVVPQMKQWTPEERKENKERFERNKNAKDKSCMPFWMLNAYHAVISVEEQALADAADYYAAYKDGDNFMIPKKVVGVIQSLLIANPNLTGFEEKLAHSLLNAEFWLRYTLKEEAKNHQGSGYSDGYSKVQLKAIADLGGEGKLFEVAHKLAEGE